MTACQKFVIQRDDDVASNNKRRTRAFLVSSPSKLLLHPQKLFLKGQRKTRNKIANGRQSGQADGITQPNLDDEVVNTLLGNFRSRGTGASTGSIHSETQISGSRRPTFLRACYPTTQGGRRRRSSRWRRKDRSPHEPTASKHWRRRRRKTSDETARELGRIGGRDTHQQGASRRRRRATREQHRHCNKAREKQTNKQTHARNCNKREMQNERDTKRESGGERKFGQFGFGITLIHQISKLN